jgi:hypothetical protein
LIRRGFCNTIKTDTANSIPLFAGVAVRLGKTAWPGGAANEFETAMFRNRNRATASSQHAISAVRAGRLFRLIVLLAAPGKSRPMILKHLKLDLRSFYRDLEKLREFGVEIAVQGQHYVLKRSFARAVARLPFPDPLLNLHEAMVLAKGKTAAHRKLQSQIGRITGKMSSKKVFS